MAISARPTKDLVQKYDCGCVRYISDAIISLKYEWIWRCDKHK